MFEAHFSDCRLYRYLWRYVWEPALPPLVVIGLNPSTADEKKRDPTITRCENFALGWGLGAVWMLNLFAFRATDPRELKKAKNPVGDLNDSWLIETCAEAVHSRGGCILVAWGNHGAFQNRGVTVTNLVIQKARAYPLWALKVTKAGQPQHPLYLPANSIRIKWV